LDNFCSQILHFGSDIDHLDNFCNQIDEFGFDICLENMHYSSPTLKMKHILWDNSYNRICAFGFDIGLTDSFGMTWPANSRMSLETRNYLCIFPLDILHIEFLYDTARLDSTTGIRSLQFRVGIFHLSNRF
tara:strand:- start:173 stop:565 length:393 start_codon:yes stop_codon:yes gene_type:complete